MQAWLKIVPLFLQLPNPAVSQTPLLVEAMEVLVPSRLAHREAVRPMSQEFEGGLMGLPPG